MFESYAWLHYHYGREDRGLTPTGTTSVIPNVFHRDDFEFRAHKENFHLFLGRPLSQGREIAIQVCRELGIKLLVAGQGERSVPEGYSTWACWGRVSEWYLARASALWCPTYYIEPFGGVAIEAALSGTPVITMDFGAFPETVVHGGTGYRCRTYEQSCGRGGTSTGSASCLPATRLCTLQAGGSRAHVP